MKIVENRLELEMCDLERMEKNETTKECQFRSMECARSKPERRKRDRKENARGVEGREKEKKETEYWRNSIGKSECQRTE